MNCTKYCCTKINNLSVKLGGEAILRDVNLHLHCGELTAIIGPNGAGKSTLLRALVGEIPYEGELAFMDENGSHHKPQIGYVPQGLAVERDLPVSVLDFLCAGVSKRPVCFGAQKNAKEMALTALKRAKAVNLANKRLGELSGGEMQRVLLAFALLTVPNILLLDEPTSGLDHNGIVMFWNTINEIREKNDIAVIIISHDFAQVKLFANSVALLDGTILKKGSPGEIFSSAEFEGIFG